jgi:tetratricopeptide (TPR) repeat protein
LKEYEEAEKYYRKALQIDPKFEDAVKNMKKLLLKRGMSEEEIENYFKAISRDHQKT